MKLIILTVCSLALSISVFSQSNLGSDSIKKEFEYHIMILDGAVKKSKTDTIYCCQVSANFMERNTYIETGTMGNMLGRYGFTRGALKQWHEWYNNYDSDIIKIVENDYKLLSDDKYTIRIEVTNPLKIQLLKDKPDPVIVFSIRGEKLIAKGNPIISSSVPYNCDLFYPMNKNGGLILYDNILDLHRAGGVGTSP